jgi:hypothetical protein
MKMGSKQLRRKAPHARAIAQWELTTRVKKFLELLLRLLITFCTEEITDGRLAFTPLVYFLVYFSGVLNFLPDCTGFLLA